MSGPEDKGLPSLPQLDVAGGVSVVIPARDAAAHIGGCLAAVLPQLRDQDEVVVAAADAATADAAVAAGRGRVRIVENPDGTTPAALNRGIAATSRPVVLRVDAQSRVPAGYRDRVVELLVQTGASVVGGRQVARAEEGFAVAVAAAMNSALGHGGARYRSGAEAGPVDTVYLGTFRRDVLEHVGGFDERFLTNQDAELNERIRRAGGTVLLDPSLEVGYFPRGDLAGLARQFRGYGRGRARTGRRHRGSLRSRQLAAPLLVLLLGAATLIALGGAVATLLGQDAVWTVGPILLLASGYGALLVAGALAAAAGRPTRAISVALALAVMHLAWGIGFLGEMARPRASHGTPPGRIRR